MYSTLFVGQSYTLDCQANFPFGMDFAPDMQWYINFDGKSDDRTPPLFEEQEWVSLQMSRQVSFLRELNKAATSSQNQPGDDWDW